MFLENTEDLAQNKLLLLYIIDKSNATLNNRELTNFILEKNYMNYFYIQQYLSELIESNFIEYTKTEDSKSYTIKKTGKIALECFEDRINPSIKKEIIDELGIDLYEEERKDITSEYFQKENNQYVVNLKLSENEITLLSLYINLPNEEQAKILCENWEKNPDKIYKDILNSVLEEKIL